MRKHYVWSMCLSLQHAAPWAAEQNLMSWLLEQKTKTVSKAHLTSKQHCQRPKTFRKPTATYGFEMFWWISKCFCVECHGVRLFGPQAIISTTFVPVKLWWFPWTVSFGIFWYLFNRFKRYQKIPKDTSRYHKIPHDTTWYHKILFFETNLFKAIWRDSSAYTAFGLRPCLSFWQHGQGNHRSSRQPASTSVAWQPARPWGVQHWGDSARHSDGRASGAPSCPRRSKHARAAWKWLGAAAVGSWVGERDGWGTWDVCRTTQSQSCLGSCSGC